MSHATATQGGAARSGDVHAALASPVRQRLLELLRASGTPTDAHQLAQTIGLHVTTVRFHLEVLRRAGLLVRGPQPQPRVGRPRTVYAPVSAEADDTNTGYQGLAALLATHLSDTAEGRAARAEQAGLAWAEQLVQTPQSEPTVADAARQMNELFAEIGFDPELTSVSGGWQIALRACPFRAVARAQPEVVCSVHAGLLRGSLDRFGVSTTSRLMPFVQPELCLAQLAPRN